ncbi:hypothetical protein, partial [Ralstonia mannitolilytica]|uniref:hypothetical protein n=1 Tax=Ralstonia mannitolilytica TaxID=105219 RepID=UPI00292DCC67
YRPRRRQPQSLGEELFLHPPRLTSSGGPFHTRRDGAVKSRGDIEAVNRARVSGRYVLTAPEFVGGLEFGGAILVGIDNGRVPPRGISSYEDSQNFLSYASHQRVYVALTRARFRVEILGTKARGVSPLLNSAIASDLLAVGEGL